LKTLSSCCAVLLLFSYASGAGAPAAGDLQFLTFDEAQPVLRAPATNLPAALKGSNPLTPESWAAWVRKQDADVRARLERGEEDTLTNLLRFGVTFTSEYRIDDEYLFKYGQSSLVNSFAENRANDLIRAMASGSGNEGIAHMRAFLEKKGFSFKTPADQAKIKTYLLANLARMRDEIRRYVSQEQKGERSQLFQDRGISLDTNLWPDFLIDQHLASMAQKSLLRPKSVRSVAIVGPGLDFANKQMGYDFYPRQTIQPFAVLDSLIRLGLCDPATVELTTLDISSEVNFHLARARSNAAAGRAYVVQLPWNTSGRMTPEYRQSFTEYWQQLGARIGSPVAAIPVPEAVSEDTQTRAVQIRPEIVLRIHPQDADIVFQHLATAQEQGFDLIIGTNIFVYFGEFEQSLARLNMALMLNRGGFVLSNDKLPNSAADGLTEAFQTTQIIARDPDRTDYMFTYERGSEASPRVK
jgi:hypothetical protein